MSDRSETPRSNCPICGKPQATRYRPFCSRRCADVDLNRWLTGRYAIPAAVEEAEIEADEAGVSRDNGGNEGA